MLFKSKAPNSYLLEDSSGNSWAIYGGGPIFLKGAHVDMSYRGSDGFRIGLNKIEMSNKPLEDLYKAVCEGRKFLEIFLGRKIESIEMIDASVDLVLGDEI